MKRTPLRRRGARAEREQEALEKFHADLWKRCGGKCERCKRRVWPKGDEFSRVNFHHITPRGRAPIAWKHDAEKNGKALCYQCHMNWCHGTADDRAEAREEGYLR